MRKLTFSLGKIGQELTLCWQENKTDYFYLEKYEGNLSGVSVYTSGDRGSGGMNDAHRERLLACLNILTY